MEAHALYEDEHILAVNKPPGMVVNRAETVKGDTLQDWIERHFSFPISGNTKFRNGIVHRLDKDTSGVLVVAKTGEVFYSLQKQFAQRKVLKTYLALVHGKVSPKEGSVSLPLKRSRSDRERFAVSSGGKKAKTGWLVLRVYEKVRKPGIKTRGYQGFTLLEVKPETGRTHQIRAHLKHLNYPIVGDARYNGKRRAREDRKWCPRQFLHAASLSITHPRSGKSVRFEAPLPRDLKKTLELLE